LSTTPRSGIGANSGFLAEGERRTRVGFTNNVKPPQSSHRRPCSGLADYSLSTISGTQPATRLVADTSITELVACLPHQANTTIATSTQNMNDKTAAAASMHFIRRTGSCISRGARKTRAGSGCDEAVNLARRHAVFHIACADICENHRK